MTRRKLSKYEQQMLGMLAEGLTRKDIADKLGFNYDTILSAVETMLLRIGAATDCEAMAMWYRGELAEIGAPSPLRLAG